MAIAPGAEQEAQLAEVKRLRLESIKAAKDRRDADAEALYWQALRVHEQVLGAEDPRIAQSLNQIIFFCGVHKSRAEAEPLIEKYAALLWQMGRGAEAETLTVRARAIRQVRYNGGRENRSDHHP